MQLLTTWMRFGAVSIAVSGMLACTPPAPATRAPQTPAPSGTAPLSSANTPSTFSRGPNKQAARLPEAVPGEFLVKFRARADESTPRFSAGARVQSKRSFRTVPGLQLVRLSGGGSLDAALAELRAHADVEYAEPNYIYHTSAIPNDPSFAQQWGLHNTGQTQGLVDADVDAPEAWDVTSGSAAVAVAVIDSGIDYTHADLAANVFSNPLDCDSDSIDDDANGYVDDCHGIDTHNGDSDPMDDDGHGTHVAGIIGAIGNNATGVAGVAWNVRLIACKFTDAAGAGTAADAIACLDYVAALRDAGINVVATNNSWGEGVYSRALRDAIDRHRQRGILFVAAAGNDTTPLGTKSLDANHSSFEAGSMYPCAYPLPNVICVAASTDAEEFEPYSFAGRNTVHVFAPGEAIVSTLPGQSYGELSGTSMATPHVTGIAALVNAASPGIDFRLARARIMTGGDTVTRSPSFPGMGWGAISQRRVNARGALGCAPGTIERRISPRHDARPVTNHPVNSPLRLAVMHVNCNGPAGLVPVIVDPGNVTVTLRDDGTGGDPYAGDGEYSADWTPVNEGTYTLRFPGLVPRDIGGMVAPGPDDLEVRVDGYIKPGFPVRTLHTPGQNFHVTEAVVANLDSQPGDEIVISGFAHGPTYSIKGDGSIAPGFPLDRDGRRYHIGSFSAGNFVGSDSTLELVGTVSDNGANSPSDPNLPDPFEAYGGNGQLLPGWGFRPSFNYITQLPALVDVDGDGFDEMYLGGQDTYLHGLRHDATAVPGFRMSPLSSGGQGIFSPLAADLDADGRAELVLPGDTGRLTVIDQSSGVAIPRGFAMERETLVFAIGDVDGDGLMNVIGTSTRSPPSGDPISVVRVVRPDGTLVREFDAHPQRRGIGDLVLADLDADGIPEIVVTMTDFDGYSQTYSNEVAAFDGRGQLLPGWPVSLTGSSPGRIAVGDVDGDSRPEIVLHSPGHLHIINHDGSFVPPSPKTLPFELTQQIGLAPAIADIDADGRNDILLFGNFWIGEGWYDRVFAYDLHGPASHGPIEWGQLGGGPRRHYAYETGKNLVADAYLSIHTSGDGDVVSTTPPANCHAHCLQRHAKNAPLQLRAVPRPGASFARWLGACAGQGATCTLSLSRHAATRAVFSSQRLSVTLQGPGRVTSSPVGIDCGSHCAADFRSSDVVTLTATPDADAAFMGWSGDAGCQGTVATCTLPMASARSVTARFAYLVRLNVYVDAGAAGTVTVQPGNHTCVATNCSIPYVPGTEVTVTATPAAGHGLRWNFSPCGETQQTCRFTMDSGRVFSISFPPRVTVSVSAAGAGSGAITSTPAGIDCGATCSATFDDGEVVQLHATPDVHSLFTHWSGECSGAGTCYLSATSTAAVTANFSRRATLTVTSTGSGQVVSDPEGIRCGADCAEDLVAGAVLRLEARPDDGHLFAGWTGACSGTSSSCTVTMAESRAVIATFAPLPRLTVTRSGAGLGTVTSSPANISCGAQCDSIFTPGTVVTLTAAAAAGSDFAGWSGACSGSSTTCTVTVSANTAAVAQFAVTPPPAPPPTTPVVPGGSKKGGGGHIDLALLAIAGLAMAVRSRRLRPRDGVGL